MSSARGWCTGKTQKDQVEREVGGGIGRGNTCKSMADSCQCMAKLTTICKVISLQLIKINEKRKYYHFAKLFSLAGKLCNRTNMNLLTFRKPRKNKNKACLSKWSKSVRDAEFKRNDTNELIFKTGTDSELTLQGEEWGKEKGSLGFTETYCYI